MTDNYVAVAVDGVGKKLQTFNNTIGVNDVHAEAITLVDSAGTAITVSNPLQISAGSGMSISGTVTANAGTNLNTSALATETTLGTVHGHVDSIDGKMVSGTDIGDVTINNVANNAVYVSAGSGATFPVSSTTLATESTLGTVHGHLDSIDTKLVSGTDIGDVTINNVATNGVFVSAATGATFPVSGTLTQSTKHDAKTYLSALINAAMSGPNGPITVVAAVANKVCKVHSYSLEVSAATGETFYFTDGSAGTAISQHWTFQGREGVFSNFASAPAQHFKTTANTLLALSGGTGVHIDGAVIYSVDDAS